MSSNRDAMTLAMCEQEEVLQIALNEMEKEESGCLVHIGSSTDMKQYTTGEFPSLNAVTKASKIHNYQSAYQPQDWRKRYDGLQDGEVCRDPYADYYGDWY